LIQNVLESLGSNVAHRVWVFSDLQQAIPAEARRCLSKALEDFRALELPVEQIWYLGDAVEGARVEHLEEMAGMQVEALAAFGVPLRYVLGNHDFDLMTNAKGQGGARAAFRDAVLKVPTWRTTESIESF
jgi:UDP-2,3-diacylglucosamine pyrophosphatase LpxH